jgi:hypothetical protein
MPALASLLYCTYLTKQRVVFCDLIICCRDQRLSRHGHLVTRLLQISELSKSRIRRIMTTKFGIGSSLIGQQEKNMPFEQIVR